jgi:hypothetical protein
MKNSIYQPPNIELGIILTEFHKFWWICVSTGVYQEKEARYKDVGVKSIFHYGTKLIRI